MRKIIHVDMDAFFASVEQRDHPEYRGKPVAVGGSPDVRGVVAAASYEARKFGIHSAMPSRTAVQRCRDLIFVRPRFDVYSEVSHQIREIFQRYTDLVEPLSLDEAYLDVTHNKKGLPSATLIAKEIKDAIWAETHLTASAGVSVNKFLAKVASDVKKPNGLFVITPDKVQDFVDGLPIEKFWGVGEVTAEKMKRLGISSGADLRKWTESDLCIKFGRSGSYYYHIARGEDDRPVEPNRVRKSIGCEESFAEDLVERHDMVKALEEIADSLKKRLERSETSGRTLTLKVKYANYQQVTRSRTLIESVNRVEDIMNIAMELLETTEAEQKNVRLLGLSVSNLDSEREEEPYVQLTLDLTRGF
jgi:DNA polymerase-4